MRVCARVFCISIDRASRLTYEETLAFGESEKGNTAFLSVETPGLLERGSSTATGMKNGRDSARYLEANCRCVNYDLIHFAYFMMICLIRSRLPHFPVHPLNTSIATAGCLLVLHRMSNLDFCPRVKETAIIRQFVGRARSVRENANSLDRI